MEISAKRDESGEYQLEMGPVTLALPPHIIEALHSVIDKRLNQFSEEEALLLEKKLQAYKSLATKMCAVDDRIFQTFAPQITSEQLVTLVKLGEGDSLREKVLRNLSRQNQRLFEEEFDLHDKITVQHACLYMEQLVPLIKKAVHRQKEIQEEMA